MPEEVFLIVMTAIAAGTLTSIVKLVVNYLQGRDVKSRSNQGSSLTTSELQRIIEETVQRAIEPLAGKIDRLEYRLDSSQKKDQNLLEKKSESGLLEEGDVYGMEDVPEKVQRQRSRA